MRHKAQQTSESAFANPIGPRRRLITLIGFGTLTVAGFGIGTFQAVKRRRKVPSQDAINAQMNQLLLPLGATVGDPIFIRLFKHEAELELWVQPKGEGPFIRFKTYAICTFSGDLGPKLLEGDRQAPEGFYSVKASQLNPFSRHHRSFNLGFPNAYDRAHGRTGSYLMIHGGCSSIGCYAMTDASIAEIYALAAGALTQPNQPAHRGEACFQVHAFPFIPTDAAMARYSTKYPQWRTFWANLREGYDAFERDRQPPRVNVVNKKYVVKAASGDI